MSCGNLIRLVFWLPPSHRSHLRYKNRKKGKEKKKTQQAVIAQSLCLLGTQTSKMWRAFSPVFFLFTFSRSFYYHSFPSQVVSLIINGFDYFWNPLKQFWWLWFLQFVSTSISLEGLSGVALIKLFHWTFFLSSFETVLISLQFFNL